MGNTSSSPKISINNNPDLNLLNQRLQSIGGLARLVGNYRTEFIAFRQAGMISEASFQEIEVFLDE